ncbi:ATP-dependent helicase, partial [Akkermansiaceae bacterium]|nr:ATP-dependent helicase [Akkermansiaceae bacterium]
TGESGKENPPRSFSDIMLKFSVPAKAKKDWEQLCFVLDELAPGGEFAKPAEMITSVQEGLYDEFMRQSFENYDNRRQDIEQLSQYSEGFEDIQELLGQLSLMSSVDGEPTGSQAAQDEEQVVLSSIHQAKGLEWKVVFLIWLADGMFPNGRVLDADDLDMFEEERRLFYVALTRSKDELYLTYPMVNPKSYTGEIFQRPSRFLEDCPEEMLETWDVGPAW